MSTFVEEVEATGAGGKPGPAPKRTSEEEEQHSPKSLAIVQDHVFVKEFVPKAAILTLNKECITVVIMRTAYARVQLRVLYSSEYPSDLPIVELSSPSLPMPLLRNKEQQCLTAANVSNTKQVTLHILIRLDSPLKNRERLLSFRTCGVVLQRPAPVMHGTHINT